MYAVEVPLARQVRLHLLLPPDRPVMAAEVDLGLGVQLEGLVDVAPPGVRIADLGTAQRVDVVHRHGHHFGTAEGALRGQVEHHLRRGLGAERELEVELDAVDRGALAGPHDLARGRHDARRRGWEVLAQADAHVPHRIGLEPPAVHEGHPAQHGGPGNEVLAHGGVHEADRSEHLHLAARHLLRRHDPEHATEVVGVAVGEEDGAHRALRQVPVREGERVPGRLRNGQGIHHDPAGLALDQRHVRQVEAAQLVDAGAHLVEPRSVVQPRLPPEARVDRRRRLALHEGPVGERPLGTGEVRVADLLRLRGEQQAPIGPLEGDRIVEVEPVGDLLVPRHREVRGIGDGGHARRLAAG